MPNHPSRPIASGHTDPGETVAYRFPLVSSTRMAAVGCRQRGCFFRVFRAFGEGDVLATGRLRILAGSSCSSETRDAAPEPRSPHPERGDIPGEWAMSLFS